MSLRIQARIIFTQMEGGILLHFNRLNRFKIILKKDSEHPYAKRNLQHQKKKGKNVKTLVRNTANSSLSNP